MGKLTPIERAIEGEPQDRRKRWEHNMAKRGFRRMTLYVPEAQVPVVEALKLALRELDDDYRLMIQQGLHDYFRDCARSFEDDLQADPTLSEETTIVEEIALFRRAQAACDTNEHARAARTERSEGERRGEPSANDE